LDFVYRVTYINTKTLRLGSRCVSVFKQEAPNLMDPLDRAMLSHWVPRNQSQV